MSKNVLLSGGVSMRRR